jgi:hypothetical protein
VSSNVGALKEIAGTTGKSAKVLVVSAHIMAKLADDLETQVKEFGAFVRTG